MLMCLNEDDKSLGTMYRVGIGIYNKDTKTYIKTMTFNGVLENVDSESFWFRVDGKISKVRQDIVTWMLPEPHTK